MTIPPMSMRWADRAAQATRAAVDEDGPLHEHVVGVQPAPVVGVVGQEHVARGDRVPVAGQGGPDGPGGRDPVVRDDPAPGDQVALGVEQGGRVVLGLGDHRADGRALDGPGGLLDHRLELGASSSRAMGSVASAADRRPARARSPPAPRRRSRCRSWPPWPGPRPGSTPWCPARRPGPGRRAHGPGGAPSRRAREPGPTPGTPGRPGPGARRPPGPGCPTARGAAVRWSPEASPWARRPPPATSPARPGPRASSIRRRSDARTRSGTVEQRRHRCLVELLGVDSAMLSSHTWRLKRRSASKWTRAVATSMPSAARSASTPSRSSPATLARAETSPGSTVARDRTRSASDVGRGRPEGRQHRGQLGHQHGGHAQGRRDVRGEQAAAAPEAHDPVAGRGQPPGCRAGCARR